MLAAQVASQLKQKDEWQGSAKEPVFDPPPPGLGWAPQLVAAISGPED
jgi:hypothetical protein